MQGWVRRLRRTRAEILRRSPDASIPCKKSWIIGTVPSNSYKRSSMAYDCFGREGGARDRAEDANDPEVFVTNMAWRRRGRQRRGRSRRRNTYGRGASNLLRWIQTGQRPVEAAVSMRNMKTILRQVAEVSTLVFEMMNGRPGPLGRPGIRRARRRTARHGHTVTERLDILIQAIVKFVSRGMVSDASAARIAVMEEGLRMGHRELCRHSVECPSLMHINAIYNIVADFINIDLNQWSGDRQETPTTFAGLHLVPPVEGIFPDVVMPEWSRLTQYIRAGGVHNFHHRLQQRPSMPAGGGGRSAARATTPPGKKGYWFAWANARGYHREQRHCEFEHALDPARSRNARGRRNRSGGGSRSATGRGSGGGGRTSSIERASGGDGGGGNSNGGGGGGGRSSGGGGIGGRFAHN